MGLLVLHWGHHAKGAVQAPVVVPVDPAGGGVVDVAGGSVGAAVEDRGADGLGLAEAVRTPSARCTAGSDFTLPASDERHNRKDGLMGDDSAAHSAARTLGPRARKNPWAHRPEWVTCFRPPRVRFHKTEQPHTTPRKDRPKERRDNGAPHARTAMRELDSTPLSDRASVVPGTTTPLRSEFTSSMERR